MDQPDGLTCERYTTNGGFYVHLEHNWLHISPKTYHGLALTEKPLWERTSSTAFPHTAYTLPYSWDWYKLDVAWGKLSFDRAEEIIESDVDVAVLREVSVHNSS